MRTHTAVALVAVAALVLYRFIASFLQARYHARRAKQLGCGSIPGLGDDGPFGLVTVYRLIKADRAKRVPDFVAERFNIMSKRCGRNVTTISTRAPGANNLLTIEPRNIQAILATQFKDFELGKSRIDNFRPLLGNGIFAADGQQWEHSRALLRPQFVREQVADLELDEKHVQHLLKAINFNADGWTNTFDVQPLFFRLTIDTATEFLFGESVDSQIASIPGIERSPSLIGVDETKFAPAFDLAQAYIALGGRFGAFPTLAHNKEFLEACKVCHDFVDYFVHRALSRRASLSPATGTNEKKKERYVFLDALAQATSDPLELRYQMLNILLAGRDTSSSTLGWLIMLLAQHPDKFHKLRSTIIEHFGTFSSPRNLTFSEIKGCSYLQHTISEVLRLYPIVPINSRRCARDTTLPTGGGPDGMSPVYVQKGQEVGYSVHVMQRRKDTWGPDADCFRPERWEGRKPTHAFEFLPFNAGPRICLGQQFAIIEASYVTIRLLQMIDGIDGFADGCNVPIAGQPVKHGLTLTSCPADGVKVRLRKTKDL